MRYQAKSRLYWKKLITTKTFVDIKFDLYSVIRGKKRSITRDLKKIKLTLKWNVGSVLSLTSNFEYEMTMNIKNVYMTIIYDTN